MLARPRKVLARPRLS